MTDQNTNVKKAWYQKWWIKVIAILFVIGWIFGDDDSSSSSSTSSGSSSCDIVGLYSGVDHLGHSATLEFYSHGVYSFDSSLGYDFDTFGDWAIEGTRIAMYSNGSKDGTCYFDSNCNLVVGSNKWKRVR